MNAQLIEAIRQLNLKPGETYTVEVDGRRIKIRDEDTAEPSAYEGQVMMLPWFESPDPSRPIVLRPGKMPPPDPVIIPDDEEYVP